METKGELPALSTGSIRSARVLYGVVAVLAIGAGLLLLAIPGSTRRFFAWGLKPPSVAALTGGLFVALGLVYAFAIFHARLSGLGVCLMSIVVTVPTFGYTIINKDVFDFGRWQAVTWLVVFAGLPILFILLLFGGATRWVGSGPKLRPWARLVMFVLAVAAAVGATALWISPTGSGWLPFTVSQFAGQLVGMWLATTAFACLWSAIRPVDEGQLFVFAACALLAGAIAGNVRTFGFLRHSQRGIYLILLAAALAVCLAVLSRTGPPPRRIDPREA